ncbi:MAG: hypothetical protein ACRELD_02605 [Longimicrobiales bacterium]
MPGLDRRAAAYAQARAELFERMLEDYAFDLDEHDRGERVAEYMREISQHFPDLDEPMRGMLMEEGMTRTAEEAELNRASHPDTKRVVEPET